MPKGVFRRTGAKGGGRLTHPPFPLHQLRMQEEGGCKGRRTGGIDFFFLRGGLGVAEVN